MRADKLPQEFLREMKALLGTEYDAYIESLAETWRPGLRVNGLKLSSDEFRDLVPWRLSPVPWEQAGFYYDPDEVRPSRHPWYYAGLYYLQEPSAMAPAACLPVTPGDRVLDLCAAPGGKSTALAAKLKGEGLLVSNDISYSRALALLKNLEMAGAANICVVSESPEKLSGTWEGFFDKILVDAPCSGEGMFRRDEEMVKDWLQRGPAYYAPIQRQILLEAVRLLRPGGRLLFSTCTFSRLEDEENVEFLLHECPEMELIPLSPAQAPGAVPGIGLPGVLRLFPHRAAGEGHFLALLGKREDFSPTVQQERGGERDRIDPNDLREGRPARSLKSSSAGARIPEEVSAFLEQCALPIQGGRVHISGESVYLVPDRLTPGLPFRFLRTGLLLGQVKKGRFEPSQALAMALGRDGFSSCLNLEPSDERVIRYLKGETIPLLSGESGARGWQLVQCRGFSLGWAKGTGASLKNKYYPGWRWQ